MSDAKATPNDGLTDDEDVTRWRARILIVVQSWAQAQKAQGTSLILSTKHEILKMLHTLVDLEQSVEVPLVVVDRPYHPCHLPPQALRKISISDLKLEVHHVGSVLIVRRIGIIAQTWARLFAAVEDEYGNTCLLIFYHHNRDVPAAEFMPEGAVLAIKQPYLRIDHAHVTEQDPEASVLCIRVDHPSDLVVLPVPDTSIPSKFASETIFRSAGVWKDMGNASFACKKILTANRCYTEGLRTTSNDPNLTADLFRNRAQTHLQLSQFDDALSDALQSLALVSGEDDRAKSMNGKALFRAASAAYQLGRFAETSDLLAKLGEIDPNYQAGSHLSNRTQSRLREQITGNYDFAKIRERVDKKGCVDVASYLSKTMVGSSSSSTKAAGLFATQDIRAGEIVLCEKAFAIASPCDEQTKPVAFFTLQRDGTTGTAKAAEKFGFALLKNVVSRITRNKSTASHISTLAYGGYSKAEQDPADDVFFLQWIVQHSAISINQSSEADMMRPFAKFGLWSQASNMKHSCVQNTSKASIGDLIVVRATRDVKAGEELFADYFPEVNGATDRKRALTDRYDMACDCALCIANTSFVSESEESLNCLLISTSDWMVLCKQLSRSSSATELNAAMKSGAALVKKMTALYDNSDFAATLLPRLDLYNVLMTLIRLNMEQPITPQSSQRILRLAIQVLRVLGFDVKPNGPNDVTFTNIYGIRLDKAEKALQICASACAVLQNQSLETKYMALAKEVHQQQNGDATNFQKMYATPSTAVHCPQM